MHATWWRFVGIPTRTSSSVCVQLNVERSFFNAQLPTQLFSGDLGCWGRTLFLTGRTPTTFAALYSCLSSSLPPPPHRPPLSLLSLSILYTRLNTNPLTSPPYLHRPPSAAALLTALFQVADCTSHYHHHHNLPVLVVHHRSLTCLAPPLACGRPGAAVATRMEIGYPSSFVVCQHSKQVCLVPGPAIIVRGNASDEPTDICISCSARDLCRSIGSDRASRHVTSRGGNCAARDLCGATTHASSPARIASSGHHHYTVASKQASKPCSRAACSHGSDGAGASRHRASWRSTQAESGDKSQHQPRVGAPAAKYTLVQERKWVSRTEVGGWMGSSRR